MTHRFPLKEIARQAGLGTATVDRVLHNRDHVSAQTKARVAAAIAELQSQEGQLAARGRRMFFDFVVEAPIRFSEEIRSAVLDIARQAGPAVYRPRFVMQEVMTDRDVVNTLARIAKRGSQGVCLKARDLPKIQKAVEHLVSQGIPVVTLVTDINVNPSLAYVGLDNASAGRTAAYLVSQKLGAQTGTVLTTRSNDRFLGEAEREKAFVDTLHTLCPTLGVVSISGGSGIHYETAHLMEQAVHKLTDLKAVYSMGGGNRTILQVLGQHGLVPQIYVAHDLDRENRALIQAGQLSFILHHDLKHDMQSVFQTFLHHHRLLPDPPAECMSHIQVITPWNIPA